MKTLLIAGLMILAATKISAQQVINFYALEEPYHILTKADVDAILEAEWDGGEFVAEISPDITVIGESAFLAYDYFPYANPINLYLLEANAPNVEIIGTYAFAGSNINKFYFPEVMSIDTAAFIDCNGLIVIDLPKATKIGESAFRWCYGLSTAKFGLGFSEPTQVSFNYAVFTEGLTNVIDLILSQYTIPMPDIEAKTWQYFFKNDYDEYIYKWRSITMYIGIEEKTSNYIYYLGNNRYLLENIEQAELFDLAGIQNKKFSNEKIVDLNELKTGIYFLQYFYGGKIQTEKIIKY
ncbi:MAG: leucine-rich repeat domain-containing protein [Bacteroidetes bacterium]|nr:leucine-rich repeat domain-containing protein [Bacteroidota bacterium]